METITLRGGLTVETRHSPGASCSAADCTAYLVIPKVSGARSYSVRLEKTSPDVPRGVPFPSVRSFTPASLGGVLDRPDAYWSELATSASSGGDADAATAAASWFRARFADLKVTVTVTF